jgi:hypothetical protein
MAMSERPDAERELRDVDSDAIDDLSPRRPRLTRGAGVFGVLALLGGFGGGFAVGQVTADDGESAVVQSVDGPSADSAGSGPAGSDSAESGSATATTMVAVGSAPSGASMESSSTGGGMAPAPVRLFRRDTADGLSVRVSRTDDVSSPDCAAYDGWCPPPECFPTAYLDALVVGEWEVAQGGAALWELPAGKQTRVLGTVSSWTAGDRVFGVLVATGPDVTSVRLQLGGSTDEMVPIDGLAVVAVPDPSSDVASSIYPAGAALDAVVLGTSTPLSIDEAFTADPACVPPPPAPPALPPAGEQPDDVEAARAEVEAVFRQAFGGDDVEATSAVVDDPTGLDELRETLRDRYPEMLGGRVGYEIGEIVFTSPTTAAYYFRPVIADYAELPRQIGGARLVDGTWMVTRDTVCSMFRLGGVSC